jgi:hypothetical protein
MTPPKKSADENRISELTCGNLKIANELGKLKEKKTLLTVKKSRKRWLS